MQLSIIKEKNPFKLELIENLKDGEISFCDHADFTDLCKEGTSQTQDISKQ